MSTFRFVENPGDIDALQNRVLNAVGGKGCLEDLRDNRDYQQHPSKLLEGVWDKLRSYVEPMSPETLGEIAVCLKPKGVSVVPVTGQYPPKFISAEWVDEDFTPAVDFFKGEVAKQFQWPLNHFDGRSSLKYLAMLALAHVLRDIVRQQIYQSQWLEAAEIDAEGLC